MTGKYKRGFTLLFASLVGTLLLALGIATFNIVLREINLSSTARESHIAFYGADSGWECAFYWDRQKAFATSTNPGGSATIRCRETDIPVTVSRAPTTATSNFRLPLDGTACADVVIQKTDPEGDKISATVIESRGRNDCTNTPIRTRVERAIRVKY
jgi:Tfp pilus assembly protein PilX